MKKVLVIAHIFPPLGGSGVQRTLKFVKYLRKYGYEPVVVTAGESNFLFKDTSLLKEIPNDIQVIRVDEPRNITNEDLQQIFELYKDLVTESSLLEQYITLLRKNAHQLLQLLLPDQYMIWAIRVIEAIKKEIDLQQIDVVYSTSGPYSDHIVGYYMKTKFNKPWVCDFRDEWSNNPYIEFDKHNLIYKVIKSIENSFVQTANRVITTTPIAEQNYKEIFCLSDEKVVTIPNGYDEEDFLNIMPSKKNKKFTIIHNGMLYGVRTPQTFLVALSSLIQKGVISKDKIEVKFSFTEDCEEWKEESKQIGLEDCITFLDYIDHEVSIQNAAAADALLLVVGKGEKAKSVYTGKVFEYLRLGKPILSLAPKEGLVDILIKETNRGYNVEYDDIEAIAQCILQLYRDWESNQLQLFPINERITMFERRNLTSKLAEQFDHLTKGVANLEDDQSEQLARIQEDIKTLIHQGMFTQAKHVIQEYEKLFPTTAGIYQMKGVIAFNEMNVEGAEKFFKKALQLQPRDADTLFNLGCLYEVQEQYNRALQNYQLSLQYCREELLKEELHSKIDMITTEFGHKLVKERKRLAFFSIKKGDNFLHDIMKGLSDEYEVKKIIVENTKQIEPAMEWADICWFEWCDDVIAYASKLSVAREKKIVCRIHSYEVFTNNPLQVYWENVDKVIVVEQHIVEVLERLVPNIHSRVDVSIIKNGLDYNKYEYTEKKKGYNLAFVGGLVYDKNPFMMLQVIKKLVDIDKRYKLFIAGEFKSHPQIKYYWDYQIKALNLKNHVIFEGWQSDINLWLEDKNYILATSIRESFGYFIAEGMAKGIKPIIHDFPGSKYIYPEKYTWNTIDEAVAMIMENRYESQDYREYIEENYSLEKQINLTKKLLVELGESEYKKDRCTFKCRGKDIHFYVPLIKDHIQRIIYFNKDFYERQMLEDIYKNLDKDSVVIDVGTNIGNHTVYFGRVCGAKVYAFEPQLNIFEILQENIKINHLEDRVFPYNVAIGHVETKGNLIITDKENLGTTSVLEKEDGLIKINTLDNVLLNELERVDVIKIDVEGMEMSVLRGGENILKKFKPLLYVEVQDDEAFRVVNEYLSPLGYVAQEVFNETPTILFRHTAE